MIGALKKIKFFQLWFFAMVISVTMTELIVCGMEMLLKGAITNDFLLTGLVASFFVAALVVSALTFLLSEMKKSEAALRLQSSITANAAEAIVLASSVDGKILYANRRFEEMFGYATGAFANQNIMAGEASAGVIPAEISSGVIASLANNGFWSGEIPSWKIDGSAFWTSAQVSVFESEEFGSLWLVYLSDITARIQAELKLRIVATAFQSCEGMFITDHNSVIQEVNRAFIEVTGYSAEDAIGQTPRLFRSGRHDADFYASMWACINLQGHWQGEIWNRRKNGEVYPQGLTITAVTGNDGAVCNYVATLMDVTARKRAEVALSRSQDRLMLATQAGGVGIWDWDVRQDVLTWDARMFVLYGMAQNQDASYAIWKAGVHPEDRQQSDAELQMALRGEKVFDTEFRVIWPDGSIHNLRALAQVNIDAAGQPLRMIGTNWDITEQKRVEQDLIAARSAADQANNAKSRFLAAASHDLRQPLTALSLYVETLVQGELAGNRELGEKIQSCVLSLGELLDGLLDLSKLDAGIVTPRLSDFHVNELLQAIVTRHAPEAMLKGLSLRARAAQVIVHSDPHLLERILGNLVSNAVRYTEQGGVLIACSRHQEKLWLEVWDTGIGIPEDMSAYIFEEFSQLGDDSRSRGSGLGLSIVAKIAALLQLQIRLRSRPGRGSMFAIELPPGQAVPVEVSVPPILAARNFRIGLVDDNVEVLNAFSFALEFFGHGIVVATDGEALFESMGGVAPDILISDYRLAHGQNGFDVIAKARLLWGDQLPAIVITGDTDPKLLRIMAGHGITVCHKPVKLATLDALIRAALEQKSV